MEMLDISLLVTTFSRQIWPLHRSATRVTSMDSPSIEMIRSILPCSVRAKWRTHPPYEYGGSAGRQKAAPPAKKQARPSVRVREEAGVEDPSLFPGQHKCGDRFRLRSNLSFRATRAAR